MLRRLRRSGSGLSGGKASDKVVCPPELRIQADWDGVVNSTEDGQFWVSCDAADHRFPAKYAQVAVTHKRDGTVAYKVVKGGFSIVPVEPKQPRGRKRDAATAFGTHVKVKCPSATASGQFVSPVSAFTQLHASQPVYSVDVAPDGDLGASGSGNGSVRVWDAESGSIRKDLRKNGHVGDVNVVRFFPSGEVVCTGGSDYQIKVWNIMDADNAVTLKGHAGGITGLAMIERGRNIVSCSRDGTARLWDLPTASTILRFSGMPSAANGVVIARNPSPPKRKSVVHDEREVGTAEKLVVLAGQDGSVRGYDIGTRSQALTLEHDSPLASVTWLDASHLAAGSQDGRVIYWDVRSTSKPVRVIHKSPASILTLAPSAKADHVRGTTADGSAFLLSLSSGDVLQELNGSDYDPLYGMAVCGDTVFTSCRDGVVRRYYAPLL